MSTKRKRRGPLFGKPAGPVAPRVNPTPWKPGESPRDQLNPGHITREAAMEGHARRMTEIAALGTPRPPDVEAQSRAAAEIAKRRGG